MGDGFAKGGGAGLATDDTLADTGELRGVDEPVEYAATQYPVGSSDDAESARPSSATGSAGGASPQRSQAEAGGRREFGRYVLEDRIGSGGMGVVYRAYDPMLDRHVALKIVRPVIGGTNAQRRLFREAQALAKIRHANIVAVYDVGTLGRDVFVAMDLVEGTPLQTWQEGREWRDVLDAYLDAGKGLVAAHEQGLVHRDIKAGNVLIDERGHATVIDFGLAAVDSEEPEASHDDAEVDEWSELTPITFDQKLTHAGALMGTPRYMAPEQHEAGQRVDSRSDQFSFALSLYEALTGAWPFAALAERAGPRAIHQAKLGGVVHQQFPAGPRRLEDVLHRALRADPEERWPSMNDLLRELRRASVAPERRRRRLAQLGAGVVAAAVAAAVGFAGQQSDAGPCDAPERYLEGVWDDETRSGLESAFSASKSPLAGNAWGRVEQDVGTFARAWQSQQVETCRATFVDGSQSEAAYDLRMMCLLDRLRPLRAMVQVYSSPDEAMIRQAPRVASELPSLDRCGDVRALQAAVPPPDDPVVADAVERGRESLAVASALDSAGKYERALAEATTLVERARPLEYGPLLAAALNLKGNGLARAGRYGEAKEHLEEAFVTASHAGEIEIAASATGNLIFLNAYDLSKTDDALIWGRVLDGIAGRTPPKARAGALADMGVLQWTVGDHERAIEYFERGLEVCGRHEEARSEEHLLLNNLGLAQASLGRNAEAIATFRRALAAVEGRYGTHHPQRGDMLNNLAEMLADNDELEEAKQLLDEAVAVWVEFYGDDHPNVAHGLTSQGNVLLKQGHKPEAAAKFERAREIRTSRLGATHPSVSASLVGLAQSQDDEQVANQHLRQALAICAEQHCDERVHARAAVLLAASVASKAEADALASRADEALGRLPATAAPELRAELARLRAGVD